MTDIIKPYWTFSVDDYNTSQITEAQIIIWKKGFCSYQYDQDKILSISVYISEKNWEERFFESIFFQEVMSEYGQKIHTIWIAEERNLLIPKNLFEGEASRLWFKRLYHISAEEDIYDNEIPNIQTHVVFAYDGKIAALIKKFFSKLEVKSLTKFSLQNLKDIDAEGSVASLILLDKTALLTVTNSGKLLTHQTFEYDSVQNIVYKIALIAEKNEFDAALVTFKVSGLIENIEEFTIDLKTYFKNVIMTTGNEGPVLELIKNIIACA